MDSGSWDGQFNTLGRGGGGTEHYCGARRRSGELPGAQAKLVVPLRWHCSGGGVQTTSTASTEEEEDRTGAGGGGRGWAALIQLPRGPARVQRRSGGQGYSRAPGRPQRRSLAVAEAEEMHGVAAVVA